MILDTQEALDAFVKMTNWNDGGFPEWDGVERLSEDGEPPHYYVPQGSTLGTSLITMGDAYERGGNDAVLLQELLRLYLEGRLRVVPRDQYPRVMPGA